MVNGEMPHQRLPDECLCLVFKQLHDVPTLRNLIYVNRFSFHVALPLLMDACMSIPLYDSLRVSPWDTSKHEHDLTILTLISILHYHRETTSDSPTIAGKALLRVHNLQLVEPVTSQPLLDFLQGGRPPSIVNYSAYISLEFEKNKVRFIDFLRLVQFPARERERHVKGRALEIVSEVVEEEHTWYQQRSWPYETAVCKAFNRLVSHYGTHSHVS
ncbi:hypothetical protein BGZ93_002734 [Podila epicladia]|nr:hypothetical protein BGZ92_009989 [Podila epicladia]KAG0097428.1 hypothetical protein BGZ93_002734 [Podila epicladia]